MQKIFHSGTPVASSLVPTFKKEPLLVVSGRRLLGSRRVSGALMATNYQAAIRTASERKPRHRSIPLKLDIDLSSIPRRDKESPIAADESTRNKLRNMNAEGEVDALPDFPQVGHFLLPNTIVD